MMNRKDIYIEQSLQGIRLSTIFLGYRISKLYIGYTKKEAVRLFKQEVKNGKV